MNSVTIDQCVEKINTRLAEEGLAATMNVRLLRHYQQNKSIPAPTQEGRFAKYNNEHVEAVVALRKAQDMGVSSKAYTTISNIEKHVDQHATVASLGLDTPAWLANSVVGSLSSLSSTPQALDLFDTRLTNNSALSNLNGTAVKKGAVFLASIAPGNEKTKTPLEWTVTDFSSAAEKTDPLETARRSALQALEALDIPPSSYSKSNAVARTMSTLGRMVSVSNASASSATAEKTIVPSTQASLCELTQWTLSHRVCVQMNSKSLSALSSNNRKAFEAWMAQLPDLT